MVHFPSTAFPVIFARRVTCWAVAGTVKTNAATIVRCNLFMGSYLSKVNPMGRLSEGADRILPPPNLHSALDAALFRQEFASLSRGAGTGFVTSCTLQFTNLNADMGRRPASLAGVDGAGQPALRDSGKTRIAVQTLHLRSSERSPHGEARLPVL